jgi:hypothetical protein
MKILSAVGQFLLFLLVFLAGSLASPFHLKWGVTVTTPGTTHYFVPDGLLLAFVLYVVILLIEAVRKRLNPAGLYTTGAFLFALILGFLAKFGSVTKDLF